MAGQVLRSVLLFPTIERMAQSPQGKLMTPLLCKLRYALYMPVYLLSFLPEGVKASLVRFALRGMKTCDESSITTSINLFSVDCIGKHLFFVLFFFFSITFFFPLQLLCCSYLVNLLVGKSLILRHEYVLKKGRFNLFSNWDRGYRKISNESKRKDLKGKMTKHFPKGSVIPKKFALYY